MKLFLATLLFIAFVGNSFSQNFYDKLVDAAKERTKHEIVYDQAYFGMDYPGGDVPEGIGVCTDVVIRAYRVVGIDLQVKIHEDMKKALPIYQKRKNTKVIDSNIDHRRVQNMMTFFERHGETLSISDKAEAYKPGDIVCWDLGSITHVGIVVDKKTWDSQRYQVVHNIGAGPKLEDFIFGAKIIGHYRYNGSK